MAEWNEVKSRAREAVHRTFARSAVYRTAPDAEGSVNITARRHTKQQIIGDLDREGYARVLQDVNMVVLDLTEIVPANGGHITFNADGDEYLIEAIEHSDDGRFVRAQVTPYERGGA